MPAVVYVAKFKGHIDHHYDVKEEQAYVADRRTPLEAPYRDKSEFDKYYSEQSHLAAIAELQAQHKVEMDKATNLLDQENGIIRSPDGWIIARLSKEIEFDSEHLMNTRPDKEELIAELHNIDSYYLVIDHKLNDGAELKKTKNGAWLRITDVIQLINKVLK